MNVSRMTRRIAVSGVATAIAAGALVGASSTAANAAWGTNDYACVVPLVGAQTFSMKVDVPLLDSVPALAAGVPFNEGDLDVFNGGTPVVNLAIGIPATVAPTVDGLGVTGLDSADLGLGFGPGSVPMKRFALGEFTDGDAGSRVMHATATNGAFSTPRAGAYDITMPKAFTMVLHTTNAGDVPITCSTDTPATIKHFTITKNGSSTVAKAPTKVTRGTPAKVSTLVSSVFGPVPTGKVVAKLGSKTVGTGTLSAGKAVMKVAKLPVGKDTLKIKYLGDGFTAPSADSLVIKVVR